MIPQLAGRGRQHQQAVAPQKPSAFGVGLLPNGDLEINGRRIAAADGLLGVECTPGVVAYKAPGLGADVLFEEATTGRVTVFRYVGGISQWFHSTTMFLKTLEAPPVLSPPARRSRRFFDYLFSRLERSVRWVEADCHPYQGLFELLDDGSVALASGGRLLPGDAPVPLPTSETLAMNGLDLTVHAENGDVVERFRRPDGNFSWRRLVSAKVEHPSVLGLSCRINDEGDLIVFPAALPPCEIAAGEPFMLHLSNGRRLTRPAQEAQIFAVDQTGAVQEFQITSGGRLETLRGAGDAWLFTLLGCPGEGDRPRRSLELMSGAMTLHDDGTVVLLGRAYLAGDAIDIRTTDLRVERDAGACQSLHVRTSASVIGYVYGGDGQWWLGTPRTPDRSYFSVSRLHDSQNVVTLAFQWLEAFIDATPGMARVNQVISTICRTADGFASQPLLLHVGIFLAILLMMGAFGGYWALQIIGLVWGIIWRLSRHIRRAWQLSDEFN